jgi:hypothetical protein
MDSNTKLTEELQNKLDQIQRFDDLIDLCLVLAQELRLQQENVRVNEDLDMSMCAEMAQDLVDEVEFLDPENNLECTGDCCQGDRCASDMVGECCGECDEDDEVQECCVSVGGDPLCPGGCCSNLPQMPTEAQCDDCDASNACDSCLDQDGCSTQDGHCTGSGKDGKTCC